MKGIKTGGRQKGVPNKITSGTRDKFKLFIDENFEAFKTDWQSIKDPKDKVKLYIDAAKFVIPALQSIDLDATIKSDKTVEQRIKELEQK